MQYLLKCLINVQNKFYTLILQSRIYKIQIIFTFLQNNFAISKKNIIFAPDLEIVLIATLKNLQL